MAAGEVRDLAAKLKLTAAYLGCSSQKEFAALFRQANPSTEFDLERSYKWLQGRSLPRSPRIFDDWAIVLGRGFEPHWLATSDVKAFADVLCAGDPAQRIRLMERAGLGNGPACNPERAVIPPARAGNGNSYLSGVYACYSHAQSPYYSGCLIRGALLVEPASNRARGYVATYSEALSTGRGSATGSVQVSGSALFLNLDLPSDAFAPVFFSLFRPAPPASVLVGLMTGATVMYPGSQPPYGCRAVLVRVPKLFAELEHSSRYMERPGETPAGDLAALGLAVAERGPLDCELDRLLRPLPGRPGTDQVAAADYALLAAACDRLWLSSLDTQRSDPAASALS